MSSRLNLKSEVSDDNECGALSLLEFARPKTIATDGWSKIASEQENNGSATQSFLILIHLATKVRSLQSR
jgi:hypothetical protein